METLPAVLPPAGGTFRHHHLPFLRPPRRPTTHHRHVPSPRAAGGLHRMDGTRLGQPLGNRPAPVQARAHRLLLLGPGGRTHPDLFPLEVPARCPRSQNVVSRSPAPRWHSLRPAKSTPSGRSPRHRATPPLRARLPKTPLPCGHLFGVRRLVAAFSCPEAIASSKAATTCATGSASAAALPIPNP